MVEAIDGGANDRPATRLQGRDKFLGQRCFARGVHTVNGDAHGMQALNVHDTLHEYFQKL
jgi:hypothetical protein